MQIFKLNEVLFIVVPCTIFTICACNRSKNQNDLCLEEFYSVVNDLVRFRLYDVKIIKNETLPVYRTYWGSEPHPIDTTSPPPPPPVGFIAYTKDMFANQLERENLDSLDASFMFNSIDSTKTIFLDSTKLSIHIISKSKFESIFTVTDLHLAYQKLRESYGSSCFIQVSTPIFNKDCTKVLISINYSCGPLWGYGSVLLLEKKLGKWSVLDDWETWVS